MSHLQVTAVNGGSLIPPRPNGERAVHAAGERASGIYAATAAFKERAAIGCLTEVMVGHRHEKAHECQGFVSDHPGAVFLLEAFHKCLAAALGPSAGHMALDGRPFRKTDIENGGLAVTTAAAPGLAVAAGIRHADGLDEFIEQTVSVLLVVRLAEVGCQWQARTDGTDGRSNRGNIFVESGKFSFEAVEDRIEIGHFGFGHRFFLTGTPLYRNVGPVRIAAGGLAVDPHNFRSAVLHFLTIFARRKDTLMRRLVLFDIDGTLLSAAGAGRVAIKRALEDVVGPVPAADEWSFAGKTDPQLTRELLLAHGSAPDDIATLVPRVLERYLTHLPEALRLATGAHLKPGVHELLDALSAADGVCIGLLTGNLAPGARLKLENFGIAERFALGAYGSDHADRPELPAIAVARALEATGHAHSGKEIVIIGDTEHDVRCGARLGVRAIAVATGPYDVAFLKSHDPDHVFADLSDTPGVLQALLS
jgi:phosphoglycolate phosphatase